MATPLTKITFEAASITVADVEFDLDTVDKGIEEFMRLREREAEALRKANVKAQVAPDTGHGSLLTEAFKKLRGEQ